jgi:hypothetical protein
MLTAEVNLSSPLGHAKENRHQDTVSLAVNASFLRTKSGSENIVSADKNVCK